MAGKWRHDLNHFLCFTDECIDLAVKDRVYHMTYSVDHSRKLVLLLKLIYNFTKNLNTRYCNILTFLIYILIHIFIIFIEKRCNKE